MEIEVKVTPSSSKSELVELAAGKLKAYVQAPPVKGLANRELLSLLAEKYSCPAYEVKIVKGLTSRNKLIEIRV